MSLPWQALIYAPLHLHGKRCSPRGQLTKELLNWQFRFDDDQRFLYHKQLPMNLEYFGKELAWYVKGERDDVSIIEHASIWKDMLNSDGTLTSNYGYLLWGYETAPLKRCVAELKRDPFSRRAVAHINKPEHFREGINDIPCTMYLQFIVRDGDLHTSVHMRSQDAVFGLRNDLPFFWFVADVMAEALQVDATTLNLTVGSFHVYERHWEKLDNVVHTPEAWLVPQIDWSEEVQSVAIKLKTPA